MCRQQGMISYTVSLKINMVNGKNANRTVSG